MKKSLAAGLQARRRIAVDAARTIDFMGEAVRVYATPSMVNDIEYACRDLLVDHLDENEDSVGIRVEIDHLAPTPLGTWVEIAVAVAGIEGPRVTFSFEVRDSIETVGRGNHTRFVVDKTRTADRIAAKAARISAGA